MSLVRNLLTGFLICATASMYACGGGGGDSGGKKLSVYLLPKQKGLAYFETCAKGAQEAAKELDIDLTYDGPVNGKADEAAKMVRQWTQKNADVIAVSVNDPAVLGEAMKEARDKGTHVITWDADAAPDTRELLVNQATPQQIGEALVDALAADIAGAGKPEDAEGEVAIISATATAANQNEWMKHMNARLAKYPKLKLIATEYCNEDSDKARTIAQDLIKAHPNLKGVWGISSTAFPGAAEGIKQAGKSGAVQVTGLSTPNDMKKYVKDGTVKSVILWNTIDLGYLTIYTADAVAKGKYKKGDTEISAGRLGKKQIVDGQVLLGKILVFNKDNIDKFDF